MDDIITPSVQTEVKRKPKKHYYRSKPTQEEYKRDPLALNKKISEHASLVANKKPKKAKEKRPHRWHSRPRGRTKSLKNMSYEEMEESKNKAIAEGNYESAVRYLKAMSPLAPSASHRCDLLIENADLLFDIGKPEISLKEYKSFLLLYPGDKRIEYVAYRVVLCNYYLSCDVERDQTKTEETIQSADEFLSHESFTQYRNEIKRVRNECCQRLVNSELSVCIFYLKRERLAAAQIRIDNIRTKWADKMPDLESKLGYLQEELDIKNKIATNAIKVTDGNRALRKLALIHPHPYETSWESWFNIA